MKVFVALTKSEQTKYEESRSDVIHVNYLTNSGKVFCKLEEKVIFLEDSKCNECDMLVGFANGDGVECKWKDKSYDSERVEVSNPYKEMNRVQKLK